jgi:hypothetical protein
MQGNAGKKAGCRLNAWPYNLHVTLPATVKLSGRVRPVS